MRVLDNILSIVWNHKIINTNILFGNKFIYKYKSMLYLNKLYLFINDILIYTNFYIMLFHYDIKLFKKHL